MYRKIPLASEGRERVVCIGALTRAREEGMLSGEKGLKATILKGGRDGFLSPGPSGVDYWCLYCLPPAATRHDYCFLSGGFSD